MATNAPAPSVPSGPSTSKPVNLNWPKQQPPKQPVPVPPAGAQPPKEGQPPQQHIPEVIIDCGRNKYYVRGIYLGRGGFARCYKIYDEKTADQFACKIVDKRLLVKPQHRDKMAQEISIHRELGHEFIVKFHSYFEDDNNVYIVLELCTRKSLLELQKRRRNLSEIEVRYYLRQILLGLDYLHSNKIIHRDLKLGNIFISEDMKLKIGDFGLATTLESMEERKRTLCGTPNYIAPEVLTKKGHSFEVDIWSTGCILFTLLVGRPPFETNSLKDTYMKIRHADYQIPQMQISTPMKELIRQMLLVDPVQRPTTKEILSSNYMTMGFIPRAMPVSALTVAPRFDKELAAAAGDSRPLLEHNPKSLDASIAVGPPTTMLASDKMNTVCADVVAANHVKTLLGQLKSVIASKPREKGVESNDEVEDPNCAPMLWISKWVDYTDKYGFGYELSDDSMGVRFNDMTKMILLGDRSTLHYIDKQANEYYYTKTEYPLDLSKKVKLLNYFQQYMVENLMKAGANCAMGETAAMTRLPNIWTWFRTSHSLIMILSNGTLQINNFKDHWKIILCPLMGAITTLGCDDKLDRTKEKTMRTFKFSAIETHGCTPGLFQKIQLAKDKLELVLKNQPIKVVQDAKEDKPAISHMPIPQVPKKKGQVHPN